VIIASQHRSNNGGTIPSPIPLSGSACRRLTAIAHEQPSKYFRNFSGALVIACDWWRETPDNSHSIVNERANHFILLAYSTCGKLDTVIFTVIKTLRPNPRNHILRLSDLLQRYCIRLTCGAPISVAVRRRGASAKDSAEARNETLCWQAG
jgi:hypothetical protein